MTGESPQYNPTFEDQAKGFAIGNNNIIYNYFGYKQEVIATPVDTTADNLTCPYRGLYHFTPKDAEFFFGREIFVEKLYNATKIHNFISVLGASGSGKSSVVFSGLVPKLAQEGSWKFTHFRPGDEPFHSLAKALIPLYQPDLNSTQQLEQSRLLAQYFVNSSVPLKDVFATIENYHPNTRLLLIADQFEELYTLCPEEAIRYNFLDLLLACFESIPGNLLFPPLLVITMRADFLGNALAYRPFADLLENTDIKLGAMNHQELTDVIEKPAQKLGVTFETGLVEYILKDIENEPDSLPLLEFALTKMWEKRQGKELTYDNYRDINQLKGALADYAENQYKKLAKEEKEQARYIFIQLVRFGEDGNDTRRRVTRHQIGEDNWNLVSRKYGLADSRLVVTSRDHKNQETVEIVHEALITHWGRFHEWLNENRDNLKKQRKIEDAALNWLKSGKKNDDLLQGFNLKEARNFERDYQKNYLLSEEAQNFIQKSMRRQLNNWLKLFVIPSIGIVSISIFAYRVISIQTAWNILSQSQDDNSPARKNQALETLNFWGQLPNSQLQNLNLSNITLSSANLSGADLQGTNLYRANLNGINLSGANLNNTNFQEANLQETNLMGTQLKNANLQEADLSGANLQGANLDEANLQKASLFWVNLQEANLSDTKLQGAKLQDAKLQGANLVNANLQSTNLRSANLSRARLIDANLRSADLSFATLNNANLSDANLNGANFSFAKLNGAELCGTLLNKINLNQIDSNRSKIDSVDLYSTEINEIIICGVSSKKSQ
ncbi:MAG TPA: hypothetical protein DCF68_16600 [Cyanothece sp. UBA12306]|nr:hypothetical protein [Cyanothece sp. UBA12306]